ncbi:MAG: hypothetical protein EB168_03910 [Euryarchaeota archaeon]|nr:hypothetical protein [Euryarchaeota archaeon]
MWTIDAKSITITILASVAWWFGFQELWSVLTNFSQQWFWFLLATIYTTAVNDVFAHAIMAHRLFRVNHDSVLYKIMSFLFVMDHGWGPLTGFCKVHRRHHTHADQGRKDVANWRNHWYGMAMSTPLNFLYQSKADWGNLDTYMDRQDRTYRELFDDTWTFFIEEYSHVLTIVFWTVLYLVAPVLLFKIVFMGRALLSVYTMFSTVFGHCGHARWLGSYRNFATRDHSHNNLIMYYASCMMFSVILQNNHHGTPYSLEKGGGVRWYEYDFSKWIARAMKPLMEKK